MKDFRFGSLRESIKPMVLSMLQIPYGQIVVKFEKSRGQEAIAALEKAYKKAMPDAVFEYDFLDELNAQEFVRAAWAENSKHCCITSFYNLLLWFI
ncbi:hypothetical protein U3A58_05850 [Algoriphagus sp. C2-6-M1]|uniref:hypothetical protein n=1 Tax=Algoriphagus persicinus TaxID=3108754 RepID=UPI002B3C1398|nr:hypothetical protein [Algoriphagus sp. C2-6-M1]MEB2779912.1 hypothetical protein [Algoriphagus sp. C2-6-M1]